QLNVLLVKKISSNKILLIYLAGGGFYPSTLCQVCVLPINEKPTYPLTFSLSPSFLMVHLYSFPPFGLTIVPPVNSSPFFSRPRMISRPMSGFPFRSPLQSI